MLKLLRSVAGSILIFGFGISGTFAQSTQIIYDDASLKNGWQNWSWATVNLGNSSPVHLGSSSISVNAGAYQALYLHIASMDNSQVTNLTFWINGGSSGG